MNMDKFLEFPLLLVPIAIGVLLLLLIVLVIRKVVKKRNNSPKKEGMFKDLKGFFKRVIRI